MSDLQFNDLKINNVNMSITLDVIATDNLRQFYLEAKKTKKAVGFEFAKDVAFYVSKYDEKQSGDASYPWKIILTLIAKPIHEGKVYQENPEELG